MEIALDDVEPAIHVELAERQGRVGDQREDGGGKEPLVPAGVPDRHDDARARSIAEHVPRAVDETKLNAADLDQSRQEINEDAGHQDPPATGAHGKRRADNGSSRSPCRPARG